MDDTLILHHGIDNLKFDKNSEHFPSFTNAKNQSSKTKEDFSTINIKKDEVHSSDKEDSHECEVVGSNKNKLSSNVDRVYRYSLRKSRAIERKRKLSFDQGKLGEEENKETVMEDEGEKTEKIVVDEGVEMEWPENEFDKDEGIPITLRDFYLNEPDLEATVKQRLDYLQSYVDETAFELDSLRKDLGSCQNILVSNKIMSTAALSQVDKLMSLLNQVNERLVIV